MKLKNYLKISALSLGLLAPAVTSCGGGSGSSNGVSGSKSGRTDYNVEVAKKNLDAYSELYSDPAKLSKEIEKIEAMTDEAAKNYTVKELDDFLIIFNTLSFKDIIEYTKKVTFLSATGKEKGKQQIFDELIENLPEEYRQTYISALNQEKSNTMPKSPAVVKQEKLNKFRTHLVLLKQNKDPNS
ncbi:MAG: hypothetical protein DCC88_11275 [Spirobacillus cienkowskii]|jgi:hypothetical protein|uniref:Lipoprotein n=1 Tax=Spirobacillus cienkowskii TaxID=495820 RepID=A0A369KNV5_9BACT|nr:MAG: hypothetical protein DCC88_11275 [Spirobacillus cienkowskii]